MKPGLGIPIGCRVKDIPAVLLPPRKQILLGFRGKKYKMHGSQTPEEQGSPNAEGRGTAGAVRKGERTVNGAPSSPWCLFYPNGLNYLETTPLGSPRSIGKTLPYGEAEF